MVKKGEEAGSLASTVASALPPAPESDSSMGSQKRDPFSHLLKFPEEMEPVYEELYEQQQERRQLDQVRITKNIMYLDRINDALDVDVKERIESDMLIEKLAISRLDAMQRKLVAQIEAGFKALQNELDEVRRSAPCARTAVPMRARFRPRPAHIRLAAALSVCPGRYIYIYIYIYIRLPPAR